MINIPAVFTKLGAIAALPRDLLSFQLGTWTTDVNNVTTQYPVGDVAGSNYALQVTALLASISGNFSSPLQQAAQQTIIEAVQADSPPGFNANVTPSITAAVVEFIRQMRVQGFTIKKQNVSASSQLVPNVTNQGNGVIVMSKKRVDGLDAENLFAETTLMACTNDAQAGNTATAGNETWQWAGLNTAPSLFDPTWPLGSGGSLVFNTVSALYNTANGNLISGGTFENWTGGVPNNFSILAGASKIAQSFVQFYTGTSSLQVIGDGATKVAFAQSFNSGTGTPFIIPLQTQMALNCWILLDSIPALGTLELALVDGFGNITTDSYGNQNSCTFDLPTIARGEPILSGSSRSSSSCSSSGPFPGLDWVPINCVFRSGQILPAQYMVRWRLVNPLSLGTNLFIDQAAMAVMNLMYVGGPSINAFDGSSHFISGGPFSIFNGPPDQFELVMTNDRGVAANLGSFGPMLFRLVAIGNDVLWPSSPSNNISDSLIVG